MSISEPTIEFLKEILLKVSKKVSVLVGTEKGAEKIERGAGGDISMHLDLVAENTIIEELEESGMDILLVTEEAGEKYIGNKEKVKETQRKLIVDPVDGSTNCSRGIPFYSVSVAYAEGSTLRDIKTGMIINLANNDLYWAQKGEGAFFNGKKIRVSMRSLSDQLVFEIDYYLWNLRKKLNQYKPIIKKLYRLRVMGSIALSFCLLAKGAIDGYIDFRKVTRLVDIAAGYLIIREAGGELFSINGDELNHDLSGTLPPIVACNSELIPFIKNELKKLSK